MRRSLYFIVLVGMLVALAPAETAGAAGATDEPCTGDFRTRLQCWSRWIGEGTVVITLDDEVPFNGTSQEHRDIEKTVWENRRHLVVEVPAGRNTGPGGTALLLLADTRWVEPDARIHQLPTEAVKELKSLRACDFNNPKALCARLAKGPLSGDDLIKADPATYRSKHAYTIATKPSSSRKATPSSRPQSSGLNGTGKALAALCAVLVLLLAAFLVLVRRSSRSPGRAPRLVAPGVGALPTEHARAVADATTTRLRVAPRYGRETGGRAGPARSAVVRTELHPQGYVELDRVLYRAVWAEPGRPPPAPGALVDVTDAPERDSDVLYAFPPTAGRHAKGTRP